MVQKELEAQRELVDYGVGFQTNAPPQCKFWSYLYYVPLTSLLGIYYFHILIILCLHIHLTKGTCAY
jgi:hypothetical protein